VKSRKNGEVEVSADDYDFSQTYASHATERSEQLNVKPRSTCGVKVSKKDAADIVIRQLTQYYKSRMFASKVLHISNQINLFFSESVANV